MTSIGEKLTREREVHATTIEEIAERTGIGLAYLQALERNDFAALPGRAFGKLYIRAYAEVLGFDPEALIGDYDEAALSGKDAACPEVRREQARSVWQQALRKSLDETREARMKSGRSRGKAHRAEPEVPPAAEIAAETALEMDEAPDADPPAPDSAPRPGRAGEDAAPTPVLYPVDAPPRRWPTFGFVSLTIAIAAAALWFFIPSWGDGEDGLRPADTDADVPTSAPASAVDAPSAASTEADAPAVSDAEPTTPSTTATRSAPESVGTADRQARLTIEEFGVGDDVVDRKLVGEKAAFPEGSVACFFTRVLGGRPGEHVRHVWIRRGREVQVVELPLGGAHWRTHSRKTLWGAGPWVVEARDANDRVLARASFECVGAAS